MEVGIIVIDIGMTNKKIAVYDENLVQRDVAYKNFPPVFVKDSWGNDIPCHDLAGMEEWFASEIRAFAEKYRVRSIAVSTHGATFVCVGSDGKPCAPCVFYTHEPGEEFQKDFYEKCGSPDSLQKSTHTPRFSSMINMAKGIFFLQREFPKEFEKTDLILNYPQYWTFKLTGKACHETTFLSCHTYLWEQNRHEWSSVVDRLGIREKLPSIYLDTCGKLGTLTDEAAEKLSLDKSVVVAAGIHDSNASLLPYLAKNSGEDFILNSTGTWCVSMHPSPNGEKNAVCADDDIGKVVFFNRSALDFPVKTSIFLGGMELDFYARLFRKANGKNDDFFPVSDMESARKIFSEKNIFVLPELVKGSGQFPDFESGIWQDGVFYSKSDLEKMEKLPPIIHDEKLFWACVVISAVIQSETAFRRAGLSDGTWIFTEGGFRKNRLYNSLLASVLGKNRVCTTSLKEATALGAAMTAIMARDGKKLSDFEPLIDIEKNTVGGEDAGGYESYKKEWILKGALSKNESN